MGWYITLGIVGLLIGIIVYSFYKMKNIKNVPPSNKIKILNNKNFKTVVKKGLVLVDFWAPWRAPCKMIAPTLNEIAEEESEKITISKVNVDENNPISQKYNIRNIPTLILFKDGKEIKRIMGVKPKKTLLKELGLI
jgi:thioredoxin 1